MAHIEPNENSLSNIFMKKENKFSCFWANIISNGLYQAIINNIVAKKTTEIVLLFHKKTTKLVFLWPNMGQKHESVITIVCKVMENDLLFTNTTTNSNLV